jgi:hypothetical protein
MPQNNLWYVIKGLVCKQQNYTSSAVLSVKLSSSSNLKICRSASKQRRAPFRRD